MSDRAACSDLTLIVAIWLTLPATMGALQALGFDFGFDIWPTGEFRNWMWFLQERNDYGAAKLFWSVDNRNALSPWWYIAARPLISATEAAPLILHLAVGLFVGLSAYLLMVALAHSRSFALSVGALSALFIANAYVNEVNWNFVGALGCTLLSIYFFAMFCEDRRNSGYLATSYLTWFVAFATYTIQVGAMIAVFFISLRQRLPENAWPRAILGAFLDAVPYVGFLILYVMLWITTSAGVVPGGYPISFSFDALLASIFFGVWNSHYEIFLIWLYRAGTNLMAVVFLLLSLTIWALLYATKAGEQSSRPTLSSLGFTVLVGACVVAPTIALEAVSNVWTPGTRWPMLMQFWPPFLLCVLLFVATSTLPDPIWLLCWRIINACVAAFIILLALGFNHFQIKQVRQERAFFEALQSIVTQDRLSGVSFPRRYLIRLADPAPFLPVPVLVDRYAHTLLGRDVTFLAAAETPKPSEGDTLLIWKDQRFWP